MIEKISPEEFEQLRIKGVGRSTPAYHALLNLRVGEGIKILKSEWRSSSKTPSAKCRYLEKKWADKKVKYICVSLEDNSGWAVQRLA